MTVMTAIAGRCSPRLASSSPVPFSSRQNRPSKGHAGWSAVAHAGMCGPAGSSHGLNPRRDLPGLQQLANIYGIAGQDEVGMHCHQRYVCVDHVCGGCQRE